MVRQCLFNSNIVFPMHLTLYHSYLITFRFTCKRKTMVCALLQSNLNKKCIRVFRSSTLTNSRWKPVPGESSINYRYHGLYTVIECISLSNQCAQFSHYDMIPSRDTLSFSFCLTRSDTQSANCSRAFINIIKSILIVSNQRPSPQTAREKAEAQWLATRW